MRKHERKALADKEQDEEWLSYELRAYRARYSQLRDERDRLKVSAEGKELSFATSQSYSKTGGPHIALYIVLPVRVRSECSPQNMSVHFFCTCVPCRFSAPFLFVYP